jgi:hypothetical protein
MTSLDSPGGDARIRKYQTGQFSESMNAVISAGTGDGFVRGVKILPWRTSSAHRNKLPRWECRHSKRRNVYSFNLLDVGVKP